MNKEEISVYEDIGVNDKKAIKTIEGSKKRFTKRDQKKTDILHRFQHIVGFPSYETIVYSIITNKICNNSIIKRDLNLALEMLSLSKYIA